MYTALDLDPEDLSTALVDNWVREGFERIVRSVARLGWFQSVVTATSTPGSPFVLSLMERVDSVVGPNGALQWIDFPEGQARFAGAAQGDVPRFWSLVPASHGAAIYLWPSPSGAVQLQVHGQRAPLDWVASGSGGVPDFPPMFEPVLQSWVMYRAYGWDGSELEAGRERQEFDTGLGEMLATAGAPPSAPPLVLNKRAFQRAAPSLNEVRYPWGG